MSKLLYQEIGVVKHQSPFDDAIITVASSSDVTIVSPYISMVYLERIVRVSSSWRLLSDVEAWLSSSAVDERLTIIEFIGRHGEIIHHYPGLHAKALVSRESAYIGSANMTNSGILGKTELGLLLHDAALLDELNYWVESLWSHSSSPDTEELQTHVRVLNNNSRQLVNLGLSKPPHLSSTVKNTWASLKSLGDSDIKYIESRDGNLENQNNLETGDARGSGFIEVVNSKPLLDIQKLLNDIVDAMAYQGFTLDVLFKTFKAIDPTVSKVDVYRALLPYCSNLARSVFEQGTVNRLIYEAGLFKQSTSLRLTNAQLSWDSFLTSIIRVLSFDDFKEAPDSTQLENISRIRINAQKKAMASLSSIGLIHRSEDGFLLLNSDFEWSSRFQLFKKSYSTWVEKLSITDNKSMFVTRNDINSTQTFPVIPVPTSFYPIPVISTPAPTYSVEVQSTKLEVGFLEENEIKAKVSERPIASSKSVLKSEITSEDSSLKEKNIYSKVDKVLSQLLIIVKNYGNPFEMKTSMLIDKLIISSGVPRELCVKIIENSFKDFEYPLRVHHDYRGINIKFIELIEVDTDRLNNFPLTKASIKIIPNINFNLPKTGLSPIVNKYSVFTKERADQIFRVMVAEFAKTDAVLNLSSLKSLAKKVSEKLSEDEEYISKLIKGENPLYPPPFSIFERDKLFHFVLNRKFLRNYTSTEQLVLAFERSAKNQQKSMGWLFRPIDSKSINLNSTINELWSDPELINIMETNRVTQVKKKADKLYADAIRLVLDFGNPIDLNKIYPTGEKVSTRLALIERNLLIISRDVFSDVPKIIFFEKLEKEIPSVRVCLVNNSINFEEYPLTREAIKKAYFLI